ncbi:MAG: methytransferase partner Trm112 [Candidatus Thermoplasmatota archaeon]
MKRDMIDILCCPICKGPLELAVEKENKEEIIKGLFTCIRCDKKYPIEEGIPDFLPS